MPAKYRHGSPSKTNAPRKLSVPEQRQKLGLKKTTLPSVPLRDLALLFPAGRAVKGARSASSFARAGARLVARRIAPAPNPVDVAKKVGKNLNNPFESDAHRRQRLRRTR